MMAFSRRQLLRSIGVAAAAAAAPAGLEARARSHRPPPVRLSRNESAYGPSPDALAALRDADPAALALYPDVECEALRGALAAVHAVERDRIAIGAGCRSVLQAVARIAAGSHRPVVAAAPGGDAIVEASTLAAAPLVPVALAPDWSHDLPRMRRECRRGAGLVYICNPHNPTGSLTPRAALEDFIRALPAGVVAVIDETYHHYVGGSADYASFADRRVEGAPVVVLRSFSKAYGLAGARVGYAVAPPALAQRIERDAAPSITAVGALAAAAALRDVRHLAAVVGRVADDRQEFYNQANARMLRVIDSHANFVMLNAARRAAPIVDHFARNGVALPPPFAPLDDYIRVTLGTRADMDEFWRVWDLMALSHAG